MIDRFPSTAAAAVATSVSGPFVRGSAAGLPSPHAPTAAAPSRRGAAAAPVLPGAPPDISSPIASGEAEGPGPSVARSRKEIYEAATYPVRRVIEEHRDDFRLVEPVAGPASASSAPPKSIVWWVCPHTCHARLPGNFDRRDRLVRHMLNFLRFDVPLSTDVHSFCTRACRGYKYLPPGSAVLPSGADVYQATEAGSVADIEAGAVVSPRGRVVADEDVAMFLRAPAAAAAAGREGAASSGVLGSGGLPSPRPPSGPPAGADGAQRSLAEVSLHLAMLVLLLSDPSARLRLWSLRSILWTNRSGRRAILCP